MPDGSPQDRNRSVQRYKTDTDGIRPGIGQYGFSHFGGAPPIFPAPHREKALWKLTSTIGNGTEKGSRDIVAAPAILWLFLLCPEQPADIVSLFEGDLTVDGRDAQTEHEQILTQRVVQQTVNAHHFFRVLLKRPGALTVALDRRLDGGEVEILAERADERGVHEQVFTLIELAVGDGRADDETGERFQRTHFLRPVEERELGEHTDRAR